jgi:hypothetical protein
MTTQGVEGTLKELREEMLRLGSDDGALYRLLHRPINTTPQQEQILREALTVVLEQTKVVANLSEEFMRAG